MISNKLYRHDLEIWRYNDHWGELASGQERLSGDMVNDIISGSEKLENPKDYLFSSEDKDDVQLPPAICPVNEVVHHNIRLNFYAKRLQRCIRALAAKKSEYRGPTLAELGKVPDMVVRRKERHCRPAGSPPPPLDSQTTRLMLEKSVITILAHAGYDKVRRVALDTLVDIAGELLSKLCRLSHAFAQHDLNRGQVAYDDVLEKTLRTIGFDGIQSVKDYYRRCVVLKRDRALARAKRFLSIYEKLLSKYGLSPSNPTIHLSAFGRQRSVALQAILQPGFQMLQTLDQEAQQNPEPSSSHQ